MAKRPHYKAIVSRKRADGTFSEVGMNDRTVIEGNNIRGLHKKAQAYFCANGQHYRMEIFPYHNIQCNPLMVEYFNG